MTDNNPFQRIRALRSASMEIHNDIQEARNLIGSLLNLIEHGTSLDKTTTLFTDIINTSTNKKLLEKYEIVLALGEFLHICTNKDEDEQERFLEPLVNLIDNLKNKADTIFDELAPPVGYDSELTKEIDPLDNAREKIKELLKLSKEKDKLLTGAIDLVHGMNSLHSYNDKPVDDKRVIIKAVLTNNKEAIDSASGMKTEHILTFVDKTENGDETFNLVSATIGNIAYVQLNKYYHMDLDFHKKLKELDSFMKES